MGDDSLAVSVFCIDLSIDLLRGQFRPRLAFQEDIVSDYHPSGVHQVRANSSGVHRETDDVRREIFAVSDDYSLAAVGQLAQFAYRIDEMLQTVADGINPALRILQH